MIDWKRVGQLQKLMVYKFNSYGVVIYFEFTHTIFGKKVINFSTFHKYQRFSCIP